MIAAAFAHSGGPKNPPRPVASARLARLDPPGDARSALDGALLANFAQDAAMAGRSAAHAADLAERALAGHWLEAPENTGVFYMAVNTLVFADRFATAERALARVMAAARRQGSPLRLAVASSYRSLFAYRVGSVQDAIMEARHALQIDAFARSGLNRPGASAFLAYALIEVGDLAGAEAVLEESGMLGEELPDSFLVNSLLFARGRLRLAQGRTRRGAPGPA